LKDLSEEPRWIINATTYETGKDWRFMPGRMGDYVTGFVITPSFPLADAIAASAAFPGLIGPLVLRTEHYSWSKLDAAQKLTPTDPPPIKELNLWDGGIYDNLGVEALFKQRGLLESYRDEYNFLLVSDASRGLPEYSSSIAYLRAQHLVDIPAAQVRALRSRVLVDYFETTPNSGAYLRMGRTARYILTQAKRDSAEIDSVAAECLPEAQVEAAAGEKTHLGQLPTEVFDRLYRHGWEVADCTLHGYCPDLFDHLPVGARKPGDSPT
jgi:NTE family protein